MKTILILSTLLIVGCVPETSVEMKLGRARFTISAVSLYSDYSINEIAADQKYDGETLVVFGAVDQIGKTVFGDFYITLVASDGIGAVQCVFAESHANQLANLRNGMNVSVKGRCDGKLMNVILRGCTFD